MNNRKIFTSESVTQGHPDKLCDLVSDSVLDAVLEQDPMGRVACETAATTGMVLVMGEITTSARIDIAQIARKAICDAGYDRPEMGFDGHSCNVMVAMGRQSPDIAMGVDNASHTDIFLFHGKSPSHNKSTLLYTVFLRQARDGMGIDIFYKNQE